LQAGGLGMVSTKHIHHTLTKLVNLIGEKSVEPFFSDPESGQVPPPEPQPDPLLQMEQLKAQTRQMEMQLDARLREMQMQLDAQLKAAELRLKSEQMMREDDRERDKNEADVVIKSAQLSADVAARAMDRVDAKRSEASADA
jgi:outer membrane cobalamin receptor